VNNAFRIRISPARPSELEELALIRRASLQVLLSDELQEEQLERYGRATHDDEFQCRVREGCVLLARQRGMPVGFAGIDPDEAELIGPYVLPRYQHRGIGDRLVVAAERLSAAMQLFRLGCWALRPALPFFEAHGYTPFTGSREERDPRAGLPVRLLRKHFPRRQTAYGKQVQAQCNALGVPRQYARQHRLTLQKEPDTLIEAGEDIYGRTQRLVPGANSAWQKMQAAAAADGVELQLVSAFRSVAYQAELLRRKLDRGQQIGHILAVSAAPGFSEHHSGRAIDLTTPGAPVLEAPFEETEAYGWLNDRASDYHFYLSYPRDNPHGVIFEPWHWAWDTRQH